MTKQVPVMLILILSFVGIGLAQKTLQRQALSIEFVGQSDRPVFPIIIATSQAEGERLRGREFSGGPYDLTQIFVVPRGVFNRISTSVVLGEQSMRQDTEHQQPVQPEVLIKLTLGSPEKQLMYTDKTQAMRMLTGLERLTEGDALLKDQLGELKSRIALVRDKTQ